MTEYDIGKMSKVLDQLIYCYLSKTNLLFDQTSLIENSKSSIDSFWIMVLIFLLLELLDISFHPF